jgi:hypothetical protein
VGEISGNEDEWQRRAMEQSIAGARKMVMGNSKQIPSVQPIGTLTDQQWGFIVTQIIFEWITVRCEQAAAENFNMESAARQWPSKPSPCDVGAIKTILPRLAELPVDWTKPLNDWSRDTMLTFMTAAFEIINEALAARDLGPDGIFRHRKTGNGES